jgi:hypothetical protein
MSRRGVTLRVIRPGDEVPRDEGWLGSAAERLNGVWTLTRICHAWTSKDSDEPRLQRSVVRVLRRGR